MAPLSLTTTLSLLLLTPLAFAAEPQLNQVFSRQEDARQAYLSKVSEAAEAADVAGATMIPKRELGEVVLHQGKRHHLGHHHSHGGAARMLRLRTKRQLADAVAAEEKRALAERETQYAFSANETATSSAYDSSATAVAVSTNTTSLANSTSVANVTKGVNSLSGYWTGASSYYIFSLRDSDRYAVLDGIASLGMKTVRIFLADVYANNKGSKNYAVEDLEPDAVGTYDDTILTKVDQLMYDCYVRGLKLVIAMHDRYALGFWATDKYATQLGIVNGGSGAQKVADASKFYTNSWAIEKFDDRLEHILEHKNPLFGNRKWKTLDEVVYAFEAQNEPQGHMSMASQDWVCDRSAYIKSILPSNSTILVSSGGGITLQTSVASWAMSCDSIDVVSVHDYGTSASNAVNVLTAAQKTLDKEGKGRKVIFGEWGIAGSNKPALIASFVTALRKAQIPWNYWQIVSSTVDDFEVWTDQKASWAALAQGN